MPSISLMEAAREGGTTELPPPLGGTPVAFPPMTAIFRMAYLFSGRKSFLFSKRTMPSRATLIAPLLYFSDR